MLNSSKVSKVKNLANLVDKIVNYLNRHWGSLFLHFCHFSIVFLFIWIHICAAYGISFA